MGGSGKLQMAGKAHRSKLITTSEVAPPEYSCAQDDDCLNKLFNIEN